jgi:hypothetical protein
MVLVLVLFTGCRGAGAFLKVAFAVGYVALRAAAAATARHASSGTPTETVACVCTPVRHGSTWCERSQDGADQCAIQCDAGFVYRDGICAPQPTFSRAAAVETLNRAIDAAQECRVAGGPIGASHARITFAPTGEVTDVELEPPYAGTDVGDCLEKKFRRAAVPDFEGDAVTVGKTFTLAPW